MKTAKQAKAEAEDVAGTKYISELANIAAQLEIAIGKGDKVFYLNRLSTEASKYLKELGYGIGYLQGCYEINFSQ